MAKYDHGGGCPCGLYAECEPNCEHHPSYVKPPTREEITIATLRAELAEAREEVERYKAALEVRGWTEEEAEGMSASYRKAALHHGHYETLFAVAAWLLRHRAALAALRPFTTETKDG